MKTCTVDNELAVARGVPYEPALNAVLTAKLEVHVPVTIPVVTESGDEFVHFGVEYREAGPSQSNGDCGPDLKQIPFHVLNKLPVFRNKADGSSVERMDGKMEQSKGGDLNSLRWEGRVDSGGRGKSVS